MSLADAAETIRRAVHDNLDAIKKVNQQIHDNPELSWEEHKAHDNLADLLESLGYKVTRHAYDLETSFSADYGTGGRLVVFNAEYDALPDIGHACGHNLIASAGLAAFIGVAAAIKASSVSGRVRLLGTPAEEGGSGKVKLIERGAYRDAAASLLLHPVGQYLMPEGVESVAAPTMLANVKYSVKFRGAAAHAALEPWKGRNALDAVCLAYNGISMLRQQIQPHERIHGIIIEGGARPNIIPERASVEYYIRSDTKAAAKKLWKRVQSCFDGASMATACEVSYEQIDSCDDLRSSKVLCDEFITTQPKGTVINHAAEGLLSGSTDMGNVSYVCPSFHGVYGIETKKSYGNHTRSFADASALPEALDKTMKWAQGMALVGYRVLCDDDFHQKVQKVWQEDMKNAGEQ